MSDDPTVPPTRRIRLLGWALKRFWGLRYVLLRRGFLKDSGWVLSMRRNEPVDAEGRPLAWYTYSALHFLEPRVRRDMDVFEFGAGNTTLWWAQRVRHVCSVESDEGWVARLLPRLPDNVDLTHVPATVDGPYARSVLAQARLFDVVAIDGYDRNNCARQCLPALKADGVIIWDNADWLERFAAGFKVLEAEGFERLEFAGIGPLNGYGWSTAVFYRPAANCLGL